MDSSERQMTDHPGKTVQCVYPKVRQEVIKWNGWGYKDTKFEINPDTGVIKFFGPHYGIGDKILPFFSEWIKARFDIDFSDRSLCSKELPSRDQLPKPKTSQELEEAFKSANIAYSVDAYDRLVRSHGHTLLEILSLRNLDFSNLRLPDLVVWPNNHDEVVAIVNNAKRFNVVIMPFGGGTSVTWAVRIPEWENRLVISLDTSQMNRLLWLDEKNLVACFEAGIVGQDLERTLNEFNLTSGHEPDSIEFSSLGGWVATRASGMKKNTYGNIEDLLVSVKMVTPSGILHKRTQVPRISCGPDFNHIILGSEGTLGVITEVALKVRPLPEIKKYGSLVFPNFESGFWCLREIARQRCQPASIRLMDNEQFQFGQALRPDTGFLKTFAEGLKKSYIQTFCRFDLNQMCVATLLFEGSKKDVAEHEKKINQIAKNFNGIPAGEKNGLRGYTLTFVIAYIRDLALDFGIIGDSFETSVPWDRTLYLIDNVKRRTAEICKKHGIKHFMISARVTQTYDVGCCVYFYTGFLLRGFPNPLEIFHEIEIESREEILALGGSLSHHHGVGKIRAPWYRKQVSSMGGDLYLQLKQHLDPENIFASGNLVLKSKL